MYICFCYCCWPFEFTLYTIQIHFVFLDMMNTLDDPQNTNMQFAKSPFYYRDMTIFQEWDQLKPVLATGLKSQEVSSVKLMMSACQS
jgi:hypothetical protein